MLKNSILGRFVPNYFFMHVRDKFSLLESSGNPVMGNLKKEISNRRRDVEHARHLTTIDGDAASWTASRWVESRTHPRVIAMFCGKKTMTVKRTILSAMMFVFASPCLVTTNSYPWQIQEDNPWCIASQILPPAGFRRIKIESGTFADWLRYLPMKKKGALVLLHNGKPEANQGVHVVVIDI